MAVVEDESRFNESYPGLNCEYDPNQKRLELLKFFEARAIQDAEIERKLVNKIAAKKLTEDRETMYDFALVDNCFFASKSKADNVAQTELAIKHQRDQGNDPIEGYFQPVVEEEEVSESLEEEEKSEEVASSHSLIEQVD